MTHITNIIDGAVGMLKPWEGLGKVALGLISWLKSTPLRELLLTDLLCQNAQQTEDYARKWYRQSRCYLTKDLVIHLGSDTTTESIEQGCLPPRWSGGGDGITECQMTECSHIIPSLG